MSAVVGIDLSSHAIDLVRINEGDNFAYWHRCELAGKDAWARTLSLRGALDLPSWWWEDVYLVAIEEPYSAGQPGTLAILNRVVGAIMATLPRELRDPSRCWHVRPKEWRIGVGIKGNEKPTRDLVSKISDTLFDGLTDGDGPPQDALDAYCIAYWARNENARGIAAA